MEYLNGIFEENDCLEVEGLNILRHCSSTTVFQNNKLWILLAVTFPPVTGSPLAGWSIPVTFEGDTFPQFSQNEKSRFHCEVCIPFQKWAMENGKSHARLRCRKQATVDNILAGTASLQFSGLVQVEEHAVSLSHKQAVDFLQAQGTTTEKQQTSKKSSDKGTQLASSP